MKEIKDEVLSKGWSESKKSFVQHYGAEELDASCLLMPVLGFLPYDDPRVASTLEAVRRGLSRDGFVYRYRADDGLSGREGVFLLCTFWLIDNLVALGRLDEAEGLLRKMEGTANHLGLFAEQYDPDSGLQLGNIPQAFTHIGYINSVTALARARYGKQPEPAHRRLPAFGKTVLNDGEPKADVTSADMARSLKASMNILRGAFFDAREGRVAYEQMRRSEAYRECLELSYALKNMDLHVLRSREEQIAFWINLYNAIVIHGVIELGIRDSIKEVRGFLKRVQYDVGGMLFSPEDIEHGILRANRRPPGSVMKRFGPGDRRAEFSVRPLEPRVHFALVCASSSCPPIGVYTASDIYAELDIAAGTFVNAGGLVLDRGADRVSLSRIFRWYSGDFGADRAGRLRYLSRFVYDEDDRKYIGAHAETIAVEYQKYDWRLNRY